jgi:site-specific recombinase XerD
LVPAPEPQGTFKFLVVDNEGRAHRPLTWFLPYLSARYAPSTVRAYVYALLRFFATLTIQEQAWNSQCNVVRGYIEQYLISELKCHVRPHRAGHMMVVLTHQNEGQVAIFLAAVQAFYQFARQAKIYSDEQPLSRNAPPIFETSGKVSPQSYPRLPQTSGVEHPVSAKRLTWAYFVVVNEQWVPKIIDDPTFPRRILEAARNSGWGLREQIVARLLFETGARVSEVCGLTLGDWHARGLRCEATTFNKGSATRRVKTIRFSESSSKLLRKYFNGDRRRIDNGHWSIAEYLKNAETKDLFSVPLFLTHLGTALTAKTFRDLYWRPTCKENGIQANVHQTRHWYVTFALREIYTTTPTGPAQQKRLNELLIYMAWRQGELTLKSYDHYLDKLNHAAIQQRLHRKLDRALRSRQKDAPQAFLSPSQNVTVPIDDEWELLRRLGSESR